MTAQNVAKLSELQEDKPLRVVVEGAPIALVRTAGGDVHAIGDTCTHGEISLADGFVEGETLECWAHGSAFSLINGKPQNLPAFEPVPVYQVTIEGDDVFVDSSVITKQAKEE